MVSALCILLSAIALLGQPSRSTDSDSLRVEQVGDSAAAVASPVAPDETSAIRQKAFVRPFAGNVRSYSGFLAVNATYDAKLFYWFFESQRKSTSSPIVLWLYGQPGRSSMLSVFEENGPYRLVNDKVVLREHSWTSEYNMLYVDSTLGAGYSSANSTDAYPRTGARAAAYLHTALKEFLRIYDDYQKVPLYVAGEAYAAKFVIALANRIHQENGAARTKINLKAVCVGAGVIDPPNQQRRADFLYQLGVVDPNVRAEIVSHETEAHKAVAARRFAHAKSHSAAVDKKLKRAGYRPPLSALEARCDLSSFGKTIKFLRSKSVRQDVHAGDAKFADKPRTVLEFIETDLYTSSSRELEQVLRDYRVLLYSGQYDMVVPTSQLDSVVSNLPWNLVNDFVAQKRQNWYLNDRLIGYHKCYQHLCQLMVRQAGHFVARSQPFWTLKAISFVNQ